MKDEIVDTVIICISCKTHYKKSESHKLAVDSSPTDMYMCATCLAKTNNILPVNMILHI